jgi:hypothetical protein
VLILRPSAVRSVDANSFSLAGHHGAVENRDGPICGYFCRFERFDGFRETPRRKGPADAELWRPANRANSDEKAILVSLFAGAERWRDGDDRGLATEPFPGAFLSIGLLYR